MSDLLKVAVRSSDYAAVRDALAAGDVDVDLLADLLVGRQRELQDGTTATLHAEHDAYSRVLSGGTTIRQIVSYIRLSTADKTLFQRSHMGENGVVVWEPGPTMMQAAVTFAGLTRLNAVAGCVVVRPPRVEVDGVQRANPYIQRASATAGLGAIERVVVVVHVLGPAPATGNPVLVAYRLEHEPRGAWLVELERLANSGPATGMSTGPVQLVPDDEPIPAGWRFELAGLGMGYLFDPRASVVQAAVGRILPLMRFADRLAQSVATRNAMRLHPALAYNTVTMDMESRSALIRVVGWQYEGSDTQRYLALLDRLAHGQELPADVAIVSAGASMLDVLDGEPVDQEEEF